MTRFVLVTRRFEMLWNQSTQGAKADIVLCLIVKLTSSYPSPVCKLEKNAEAKKSVSVFAVSFTREVPTLPTYLTYGTLLKYLGT